MKKVFFFAAMLCGLVALNAQTQIGLLYNGQCYQNGDAVLVKLDRTAEHCDAIGFRNQTSAILRDLVASMTEEEINGVEAWGMCTGTQCVPTLTSAPFMMTPNSDYTEFVIDLDVEDVELPSGHYTLTVSNGTVTCSWDLLFQAYNDEEGGSVGINDVVANAVVSAYPNPAQGQVNICYNVEQPSTLAIYDVQGRVVRQMNVQGEGTMQVNGLASGIYAYGIAGSQMHKLVVK